MLENIAWIYMMGAMIYFCYYTIFGKEITATIETCFSRAIIWPLILGYVVYREWMFDIQRQMLKRKR